MTNYDGRAQTPIQSLPLFCLHTALLRIASSLLNWFSVTHGWKWKAHVQIRFWTVSMETEFDMSSLATLESLRDHLLSADGRLSINLPEWKTSLRSKNLDTAWVSDGYHGCNFQPFPLRLHHIQVPLRPTTPATITLLYLLKGMSTYQPLKEAITSHKSFQHSRKKVHAKQEISGWSHTSDPQPEMPGHLVFTRGRQQWTLLIMGPARDHLNFPFVWIWPALDEPSVIIVIPSVIKNRWSLFFKV